jgi:hypothetical protein
VVRLYREQIDITKATDTIETYRLGDLHAQKGATIKCGEVSVDIRCDTSELEAAIVKVKELIDLAEKADRLGVAPVGLLTLTAGAMVVTSAPKQMTRRGLLTLGRSK